MVFLATLLVLQGTPTTMLRDARTALEARQLDRAGPLLESALRASATPRDSLETLFWTSVWHFYGGRDSLARVYARGVFAMDPDVSFVGVAAGISPSFMSLLEQERHAVANPNPAYMTKDVEVAPARLSGPAVVYPPGPWRRQIKGRTVVQGVVDTTGRLEPDDFEIIEVPDSELVEPVREAMLAARFSPGRIKGKPVRTMIRVGIMLQPGPPPNPADLVRQARSQIASRHADSALALLDLAADPLVRATPGVLAYAQLVRGLALQAEGRDSLASVAFDAGLAGVTNLTRQGVDLAPSVRQLADSVRRSRRAPATATATAPVGAPTALEPVDRQPTVITAPPVEYPPEMRTLGVGGTVIVEQTIDSTGRPVPGTARVAQSPNPGLNAAALKVVTGAQYRPALRGGQAVRVVIRQPVTFFQ